MNSSQPPIEHNINLDLPEELIDKPLIVINTDNMTTSGETIQLHTKTTDSIPYGILKGGTKPTYRNCLLLILFIYFRPSERRQKPRWRKPPSESEDSESEEAESEGEQQTSEKPADKKNAKKAPPPPKPRTPPATRQ